MLKRHRPLFLPPGSQARKDKIDMLMRLFFLTREEALRFVVRQNKAYRNIPMPGERCGAFARTTGKPCKRKALDSGRCPNHGGLSTGPRTSAGKAKALSKLKQFRR